MPPLLLAISPQDAAASCPMQSVAPPPAVWDDWISRPFYLRVQCHRTVKMELSKKIKTALNETRMLILGAQILLGFELRAAFSEGFDKLPDHARHIEALALMLMTVSIALMIAPGPYHRIVEGGRDSGPFYRVTTSISDLALLPFGLALGLDVFVSIEHVIGSEAGIAAGIAASIVALGMWYALPRAAAQWPERA